MLCEIALDEVEQKKGFATYKMYKAWVIFVTCNELKKKHIMEFIYNHIVYDGGDNRCAMHSAIRVGHSAGICDG